MGALIHPDIDFLGPLAKMSGKNAVVSAAQNLAYVITNIEMRAEFASNDKVVLIFDMMFPAPIGKLRSCSFMTLKDGLIYKIELFYDASLFEDKKKEIFKS